MFDLTSLIPLASFALVASVTPGPNVLMIAASGANFGFRRTIWHMTGISVGFPAMLLALGLGMDQVFRTWPEIHQVLKVLGTAYMAYLAWRIATASGSGAAGERGRPLSFFEAALFQWVNPKAWVVGISALATFTTVGGEHLRETVVIAAIFLLISIPALCIWCLFGTAIRGVLSSPSALRAFNLSMGLLLAASIVLLYI